MRPERKKVVGDYKILVEYVSGGDIANIIRGHILVKDDRVPFTGIAYGRYGGQNVAPKLSPSARKRLKQHFSDLGAFEEDLQLRLVEGDFEMTSSGSSAHNHHHIGETRE